MISLMGIQSGENYMQENRVIERMDDGSIFIHLKGRFTAHELLDFVDRMWQHR